MASRTNALLACGTVLALLTWGDLPARGQGIVIDHDWRRPVGRTFEVREVSLDARVRDQVAEVQVSQTFSNPGSFQVESEYLFPLPEDGAVQNFVLLVDGRELPGRLMPKDEARRIFEQIVRAQRDPALLEYMGRGLFRSSVFPIPPGAERKVTMRYTQVCKRDRDVVEFAYPFSTQKFTAKPIGRLALTLRVESRDAIKSVYSPTHGAEVRRDGDHEARVSFEQRQVVPSADFRLLYTLADGALGASVVSYQPSSSEDGYFLLLASPRVKPADEAPRAKTVVFAIDRSGSMAGKKIAQARNALKFVLGNLGVDDTFNIIAYDDRVEAFKPELQRYSPRTHQDAERFVENIREGGSTNIDAALAAALGMVRDDSRPSYVLFLTDGLPTAGETKETAIAEHGRAANKARSRLFAFGVGYDVNARLLDRLSGGNGGTSEYVKPDEDIEAHVARFYSKFTSPALAGTRVELAGVDTNRVYPRDVPDLFEGGQIVLTGRYRQPGPATVRVSGRVGGETRRYEFPADLAGADRGANNAFVEKLWATRRVGDLIDQIDLHGPNKELTDELTDLSTRYGILTPYTSFLADERTPLHAASNNARVGRELEQLGEVGGMMGVNQRGAKAAMMTAQRAEAGQDAFRNAAAVPFTQGPVQPGAANAPALAKAAGRYGFAGGMMAGLAAKAAEPAAGPAADSVRQVGAKTFYRKANRWIDSTVKADDEATARVVRRFSDAFFDLARGQSADLNRYLTFDEPVVVRLEGQVYRFDPPAD